METTTPRKIEPRTYTLKEAADILGYPRSTAYDLVRRGEFPVAVIRGARTIRVAKALVDAIAPDTEQGRA